MQCVCQGVFLGFWGETVTKAQQLLRKRDQMTLEDLFNAVDWDLYEFTKLAPLRQPQ
jgi:hypothetical protein